MSSRRDILKTLGFLGCSAAASPLVTSMSFASAPWDNRLVTILLRGAMDGLAALPPLFDPDLSALRPTLSQTPGAPLAQGFGLHPALEPLRVLWQAGELSFVPAVSTPYRDGRSHFDGQDVLEAGSAGVVSSARGGWLNRLLSEVPGLSGDTAFAVGREKPLILSGDFPSRSWSPETRLDLSSQARLLLDIMYADDPLFHAASDEALEIAQSLGLSEEIDSFGEMASLSRSARVNQRRAEGARVIAEFAANRLLEDARIAAFSLDGWDTHRNQHNALPNALGRLADAILSLRETLGPVWQKTAVLVMTEFGRTAAENGTKGTDHGTGGTMIVAGGAVRGGQILGTWPGLDEAALYQRRDLMPTDDVRRYSAWAMRGLFGFDRAVLQEVAFPGLDMGDDPGVLT